VEFYTYAVFAFALLFLRQLNCIFVALVVLLIPIPLLWFVGNINTDYDFGFLRCLLGFFVGVACYDFHLLITRNDVFHYNSTAMSLIEICCVGLVTLFVCLYGAGPLSLAAPLIFGLTVILFSLEGGILSKMLRARPFVSLGALSYSIYMVHGLVLIAMAYALQLAERASGALFRRHGYFGTEMWQGDLYYVVLIVLVVGTSYLTYDFIEQPGRKYSRKLADRIFGATGSLTLASANSVFIEESRRGTNDEQGKLGLVP
jgi:peptidoglycan/LPS O-acetylase OafA/YrhL